MSNPTVTVSFVPPDPNAIIASLADLVALLDTLVTSEIQGSYIPYVVGAGTPAVDDQDKAWHRTDDAGRPLGTFLFYNGSWRREYTGLPYQIRMFSGDPGKYFDATGLGLPNLEWDGWGICNGQNNTTNLSDLFVVGGRMDNVGVTGWSTADGWRTNATGTPKNTGGANTYAIQNNNLPAMKVQLTGAGAIDPSVTKSEFEPIVTHHWTGNANNTVDLVTFGADPSGTPPVTQVLLPTVPAFYALCFCQFVGYG